MVRGRAEAGRDAAGFVDGEIEKVVGTKKRLAVWPTSF
jgi:hypothetical protein